MWDQIRMAVRSNPVEMFMAVLVCCLNCYRYEKDDVYAFDMLLYYFPVLFLFSYMLNQCFKEGKLRWIYYFSIVPCFILWGVTGRWSYSAVYLVSLVVIQLVYLASGWKRDNTAFMREGLRYLRSFLSAGVLAGIVWLLSLSIYLCVTYIFEFWEKSDNKVFIYIPTISFMGVMPLLFLMLHGKKDEVQGNRLFDVLLNYVLSPALLIYAVILYLYFIKIAVLWSLPKGGVAYIVVCFTIATFLLKGFQVFLSRRYYDWFYKQASFVVMPTLVMYWIGAIYRIQEYGFTELRVYLVVVGVILTVTALIFFSDRWGRYLYVACVTTVLLSVVTYIPGITAKDIERISQEGRGNGSKEIEIQYSLIDYSSVAWDNSLDISGYNSLEMVTNNSTTDGIVRLDFTGDSLSLYNREGSLFYKKSGDELLDQQLAKVGLTRKDSIPKSVYPELLQLELDSGKIVFGSMNLKKDSMYHIFYISGQFYLKK